MSKQTVFTGAGVALITPMHADGSLNLELFRELVEEQIENGTDAIIACGTTGEASTLTHEEHLAVLKAAVEQTAGRVPVIAGAGSNDTAYGIEISQEAKNLGCDALLWVTPYYNKTSQRGLVEHFNAMANAVKMPAILYSVPSRTGVNIAPDTVYALSKNPYIVGIKEASGNITQMDDIIKNKPENFDVISGDDGITFPLITLGAVGVISVIGNAFPR